MAETGEQPILWHIMKSYGEQGFTDFVICLGYKGYVVKECFASYFVHSSDVAFDLRGQCMEVQQSTVEPWQVTLGDAGTEPQTGGRLKGVAPYRDPHALRRQRGQAALLRREARLHARRRRRRLPRPATSSRPTAS